MSEKAAEYKPDYDNTCIFCGLSPVVNITTDKAIVYKTMMCGLCTFGTVDAINPEKWKDINHD